jgi:hypothetical protein
MSMAVWIRVETVHLLTRNADKLLSVDGGIASWQFQMIDTSKVLDT